MQFTLRRVHIPDIFSTSFCITSCSSSQPPSHPIPQTAFPSSLVTSLVTSIYHSAACARMIEESNAGHLLQTASFLAVNSVPFAVTIHDNSHWIVLHETVSPPLSEQSTWSVVFPLCIDTFREDP